MILIPIFVLPVFRRNTIDQRLPPSEAVEKTCPCEAFGDQGVLIGPTRHGVDDATQILVLDRGILLTAQVLVGA